MTVDTKVLERARARKGSAPSSDGTVCVIAYGHNGRAMLCDRKLTKEQAQERKAKYEARSDVQRVEVN